MTTTVTIVCDDASHRDERVWTVARVERREDPQAPGVWSWLPNREGLSGADPQQVLVGDDRVAAGEPAVYDASDGPRDMRGRWTLECPLCGRRVRLRGDKMTRAMTGLSDAGLTSVSLSVLAANV